MVPPPPAARKAHYHTLVAKVHAQRLSFYNRIAALGALIVALVLGATYFQKALVPLAGLAFWGGFLVFRAVLEHTQAVEGPKASNRLEALVVNLVSVRFALVWAGAMFNFVMVGAFNHFQPRSMPWVYHETPTNTIRPFLDPTFTMFLFGITVFSLVFATVFVLKGLYLLDYRELGYRQEPVAYLKGLPHTRIAMGSLTVCFATALAIPILYWVFKDILFNVGMYPLVLVLGLNSSQGQRSWSMSMFLSDTFVNVVVFLTLTVLTYLYNAYTTVGCLVVDKPISSYSETPFTALVDGLNDVDHPLARITAFQELLYMATTPNIKTRQMLYKPECWVVVLDIFGFVLSNAAKSARADLPKSPLNEERSKKVAAQASIFGNLSAYKNTFDDGKLDTKLDAAATDDITVVKKGDASDLFKKSQVENKPKTPNLVAATLTKYVNAFETSLNNLVVEYQKKLGEALIQGTSTPQAKLVHSTLMSLHSFFFGNAHYQAQRRVQNKYIIELCVEALAELLIHCKGEDPRDVVLDNLTETLILLAKVYKGTSQFIKNYPSEQENAITELNQLTIKCFYKLVVFHNSSLNDLILPPEVFKLAKWCTDLAVEMDKGEIDWDSSV